MSISDEARAEKMCPACVAYIAHYPVMAEEWECEHTEDEQAFMLALADAIHGSHPEGEFVDAGWRAAQFLDDAEVALDCGHAPYVMRITHNVEPWSFLALVNGRYLIGTRNDEGAELESVADIGWLGIASRKPEAAPVWVKSDGTRHSHPVPGTGHWEFPAPKAAPSDTDREARLETIVNGAIPYTIVGNWRVDLADLLTEVRRLRASQPVQVEATGHGLRTAIQGVLWNAGNYPSIVQAKMLGQDVTALTDKVTSAVLAALGGGDQ